MINFSRQDPANWSCGMVPDATKRLIIPAGTPFNCTLSGSDAVIDRIWLQPGAILNINNPGKLQVSGTNLTPTW